MQPSSYHKSRFFASNEVELKMIKESYNSVHAIILSSPFLGPVVKCAHNGNNKFTNLVQNYIDTFSYKSFTLNYKIMGVKFISFIAMPLSISDYIRHKFMPKMSIFFVYALYHDLNLKKLIMLNYVPMQNK